MNFLLVALSNLGNVRLLIHIGLVLPESFSVTDQKGVNEEERTIVADRWEELLGRWNGTEDCLGVKSMVPKESMQNLAENGGEMGATARYLKRAADQGFNGNSPFTDLWLQLTVKTAVEIIGKDRFSRIEIWNQKTKVEVSFVLSDLRSYAAEWFPKAVEDEDVGITENIDDESDLGRKKIPSETKVEQDLMNFGKKNTAVKKMILADVKDFLENGSVEETAEHTENKRVQPLRYNGNGGAEA